MRVFIDTSAILTHYDADDEQHGVIEELWQNLLAKEIALISTNYVLLETASLMQRRFGLSAVLSIEREIRPWLDLVWVDIRLHDLAVAAALAAERRDLSIVDCVSFEIMRRYGLSYAMAVDKHFVERGYPLPPLS